MSAKTALPCRPIPSHRETPPISFPPGRLGGAQNEAPGVRTLRLDEIFQTQERNIESAVGLLDKIRAVRERTLGSVPGNDKAEATPCRAGKLGVVEDQADQLNRLLLAIHDVAEDLLGI